MTATFTLSVELPHPPETVFGYLAEPRNRPAWQRSLRAVAEVDGGEPRPGLAWRDVTRVGIRPQLRLTEVTPYRTLAEQGTWRGVDATLTMRFVRTGAGTRVTAEGELTGQGVARVLATVAARLAPGEIRADLERVGRLLSERA